MVAARVADLSRVDLFHATFNIMPAGLTMPVRRDHPRHHAPDPAVLVPHRLRGVVERHFYGHGLKRAIRHADAIAAISAATAREIAHYHPPAAARTSVTASGVAPHFRPLPPDPAVLAGLGLTPGKPFVLTIGQDAPYKNHEGALRGFAAAFPGEAPIELVFVQRQGAGRPS